MAKENTLIPMSEVVATLSLTDLCRISGSPADWIIELVHEGILEPVGAGKAAWRFESSSVTVIHRVRRLQGDLGINLPGVALALSLAAENAQLKRRLSQVESKMAIPIQMPPAKR
ncbi:hypothetical protein ILP92_04500 [Maribius pontilimi]|uniref:Chaperone modulatory protein CbpM n=1 Tax=Palleronia pontilimi TaxID=1964209 RepID=A0A934IAE2_9RHOB|nr:chaperone modulator CbpM [Palleronia pontilimi]MBJ3762006.1 hypothetical protein [Palleronia pontilimi]